MKFCLDYCGVDEPDTSDEEKQEKKEAPPPKVFSNTLEQSLNAEKRQLINRNQKREAEILEENKNKIFTLWEGAQQELRGQGAVEPVRKFITARLMTLMPHSYCFETRPFSAEDWNFLSDHEDSLIRILYGTFMEFLFPGDLILKEFSGVFSDLHVKLHNHYHAQFLMKTEMMKLRVGGSDEDAAKFLTEHPEKWVEDRRLREQVVERCTRMGTDEATVRRMVGSLPRGLLALSINGKEEAADTGKISASRDPSPEPRENQNEDVEMEEEEEEDEDPLAFLMPSKIPITTGPKIMEGRVTILKGAKGWFRSDHKMTKEIELVGKISYKEYKTTKKKVTFKDTFPTDVHIYFPVLPLLNRDPSGRWQLYGTGHCYGSVSLTYDQYQELKPVIGAKGSRPTTSPSSSIGSFQRKLHGRRAKEILFQNPLEFVKTRKLRPNSADENDPEGITLPVHVGKRKKNMGKMNPFLTEQLQQCFFQKMLRFNDKWFGSKIASKDHFAKTMYNYSSAVLILTDGIFEEVDGATVLNGCILSAPPPLNNTDILKLLVDVGELNVQIRDVIVSWGFDDLVAGKTPEKAAAALVAYCARVEGLMKKLRKKSNDKLSKVDEALPEKPRMWMFTIPEAGDFTEQLIVYNNLVRKVCADDFLGFQLLDWAMVTACAPPEFFYTKDIVERRLQLFFRLCREECDLLYRRGWQERSEEKEAVAKDFGTGPWLKDFYASFSLYEGASSLRRGV